MRSEVDRKCGPPIPPKKFDIFNEAGCVLTRVQVLVNDSKRA